ncbi:hypothetical protein [Arundinibacter roseus]|uniref:hypothetical protein n=1 Tax=Arundinibacter roseus TaxID=2070510 RepID=UPI0014055829|nr:hypothetical protein [Arundinibacter roseus]
MKNLKYLSYIGLLIVLVAPFLFYADSITKPQMNNALLGGTVVWFATAAFWIKKGE